jgi:activating signal cointegrator complex subunit 3
VLSDHLNAEIVAATITTKQEAMDYLTWTYFFRRLLVNPSYYELESLKNTPVNKYLSFLVQRSLTELEDSYCVTVADDGQLQSSELGRIASYYYLSHKTVKMFKETLSNDVEIELLLDIVSQSQEFEGKTLLAIEKAYFLIIYLTVSKRISCASQRRQIEC